MLKKLFIVCGTTGQRKACKDCSCGLADELDAEAAKKKPVNSAEAKSSCGSVSYFLSFPIKYLINYVLNTPFLQQF